MTRNAFFVRDLGKLELFGPTSVILTRPMARLTSHLSQTRRPLIYESVGRVQSDDVAGEAVRIGSVFLFHESLIRRCVFGMRVLLCDLAVAVHAVLGANIDFLGFAEHTLDQFLLRDPVQIVIVNRLCPRIFFDLGGEQFDSS